MSQLPRKHQQENILILSYLPQVFLWLAEALRTVRAVLNAAAMDGVVVLVVQQQRSHNDHIRTVRHRVTKITQLAVIAGHNCFRITAV